MTCIVGITDGATVTIGGDSAGVAGWQVTVRADQKVWAVNGWAFGFTTSFRMGQLLRWSLVPPPVEGDLERYMATTFIDAVRACLKAGGFAKADNGREEGGEFLVGHAGRLFQVASDYQVGEPAEGVAAVGCGDEFALGAVLAQRPATPAKVRVIRALEIAARCSGAVAGPFHVVSVRESRPRAS